MLAIGFKALFLTPCKRRRDQNVMTGIFMLFSRHWFFLILAALYIFSRLYRLDGDIPIGWDVSQYNQFDELLYSIPGLNLFHYGTWDINPWGLRIPHNDPVFSIWNFVQYFLLTYLNNPLFALRIPAVVAGLIVYLIYLFCLERLKKWLIRRDCFDIWLYALFAVLPLFDLTFFLANVINEPTIFRLMSASLIFLLLLQNKKITSRKAFLLGIVAASSIVLIYIYNAFLILFIILVLVSERKYKIRLLVNFLAGLSVIFIGWLLATYLLRDLTLLEVVKNLAVQRPVKINIQFYDYVIRLTSVIATNFLIFSPILIILVALGANILYAVNIDKKLALIFRKISLLTILYLISYSAQAVFVPDYPQRKGLVLYLPILIMAYLIANVLISARRSGTGSNIVSLIFLPIIGLGIFIYSIKLTIFINYRGYFLLFNDSNVLPFIYVAIYGLAILVIVCVLYSGNNRYLRNITKGLIAATILSNAYLVFNYCIINTDRTFREMIGDISGLPPGNYIGNWSYGLSFANRDNKPLISPYYSKYLKDPLWEQSDNSLNMSAFSLFLNNDLKPIYTAVQGRDQLVRVLEKFPFAKVRYANMGFRDQTSYLTHFLSKRSVLIGDEREGESNNEMYIIQLNP